MSGPPHGKPIPGRTNLGDVEWALTKARRYIFGGGDPTDPRYRAYVDCWLDYRAEIAGTPLERVDTTRELKPGVAQAREALREIADDEETPHLSDCRFIARAALAGEGT